MSESLVDDDRTCWDEKCEREWSKHQMCWMKHVSVVLGWSPHIVDAITINSQNTKWKKNPFFSAWSSTHSRFSSSLTSLERKMKISLVMLRLLAFQMDSAIFISFSWWLLAACERQSVVRCAAEKKTILEREKMVIVSDICDSEKNWVKEQRVCGEINECELWMGKKLSFSREIKWK